MPDAGAAPDPVTAPKWRQSILSRPAQYQNAAAVTLLHRGMPYGRVRMHAGAIGAALAQCFGQAQRIASSAG